MTSIKVRGNLFEISGLTISELWEVLEEEARMFLHVSMDEAAWLLGGFNE